MLVNVCAVLETMFYTRNKGCCNSKCHLLIQWKCYLPGKQPKSDIAMWVIRGIDRERIMTFCSPSFHWCLVNLLQEHTTVVGAGLISPLYYFHSRLPMASPWGCLADAVLTHSPLTAVTRVRYSASACEMVMWSPSQTGGLPPSTPVSSHMKTIRTQTSMPTRMN